MVGCQHSAIADVHIAIAEVQGVDLRRNDSVTIVNLVAESDHIVQSVRERVVRAERQARLCAARDRKLKGVIARRSGTEVASDLSYVRQTGRSKDQGC